MLLTTYFDTSKLSTTPKLCSTASFSRSYDYFQATLNTGAGYVSVGIYICVFIAYRRAKRQIVSHHEDQIMAAQERRLTVTLGIITISTLFLVVIPDTIYFVCAFMNVPPPETALLGIINRLSTICNVAIYVVRQKEMRKEMWALIMCKKTTAVTAATRWKTAVR
jgi:hypothetical protein